MPLGGGGLDFRVGSSNSQLTSAATSLRPFSRTIAVFQPEAPSALMTSPQNRRDNSRKYLAGSVVLGKTVSRTRVVGPVLSHRATTCANVESIRSLSFTVQLSESSGSTFVSRSSNGGGGGLGTDCCGEKVDGVGGFDDSAGCSLHPRCIAVTNVRTRTRSKIMCRISLFRREPRCLIGHPVSRKAPRIIGA